MHRPHRLRQVTRKEWLRTSGGATIAVLAGCVSRGGGSEDGSDTTDAAGNAALALGAFQYVEFAGDRA